MRETFVKFFLAMLIGVGSTYIGYKFLVIDIGPQKSLRQQPAASVNVEPVFTTQTLPEHNGDTAAMAGEINNIIDTVNDVVSQPQHVGGGQEGTAESEEPYDLSQMNKLEWYEKERMRIVEDLRKDGSEVLDSRVFVNKKDCDITVRRLMSEYLRRGIPKHSIVETDPFPNSTGVVIMFNMNDRLHYAGCLATEKITWAIYVQYTP